MITVLRIGHRPERDKRITTHVALVARAFGAQHILVDTRDPDLEKNFISTCERWGGQVSIRTGVKWKDEVRNFKGRIVHLTMYGETVDKAMDIVKSDEDIMIVVGAEKVPREVYDMATINVSVGNQPHSEVAALAIFLYRLADCTMPDFDDGQMKILPNPRGKTVVENE
ncbi:MAG: tRNA (cytidine(56)-2'-O)-methyltransferase [Candidatus Thermoplasmatota archaeon]|nr:tRNA (cytidine(56)-2'-O)-methyltransferase [Euryarchaeota archaeon]MBU4031206.1 tRNA (cytidine(56)-2'-O)-methyltransferase [Candidatus Thermoplasmatota archaeon]MBU4070612.1 tRNA (cytidine(56)-2'-O)-methyltransferase [Candidatus Thermoplasmatota archaeon]MBU4143439.1 tRNA (cytidine(56)-2'-O)-methyltransferase [Candidatus Thermoplasmatota archaeon]MBU4592629.1 tRNA (cytidine(56)-2'-O)-methyltransferase [Candidatus Thermoplasmatota archaeon]